MLTINLQTDWGQSPEDVAVSVYDGYGGMILDRQPGSDQIKVKVPDGLYTIRVEIAGRIREQNVHVKGDKSVIAQLPELYPATFISSTNAVHESHARIPYAFTTYTITANAIGASVQEPGELAILVRAFNEKDALQSDLGDSLFLSDLSGNVLCNIDVNNCIRLGKEFQGFRASIEPGVYCLVYPKKPYRAMVLQIFPDRQTQIYLTHRQRPLIEEAGMFLPRLGEAFNPFSSENRAAFLATRGLINNKNWLPKEVMHTLLYGKFQDPMLGLLGAFILVKQKEPDIRLLEIVLGNLNDLLPGSIDVQVLRRLFATYSLNNMRTAELEPMLNAPPMLRAAMESAIQISWKDKNYLVSDVMTKEVAPSLYTDSAWTSWRPSNQWGLGGLMLKAFIKTESSWSWVVQAVQEQVKIAKVSGAPLDAAMIAQRMRLPTGTVAAILNEVAVNI